MNDPSMAPGPDHNRRTQGLHPAIKIFVIGFNRAGTRSLHHYFTRNGIRSIHWPKYRGRGQGRQNLAWAIEDNFTRDRPILEDYDRYTAFSDFTYADPKRCIEGNKYFREFYREYPEAYFILNDRDPGDWIRSRYSQQSIEIFSSIGKITMSFAERQAQFLGVTQEALGSIWREAYEKHKHDVLSFFADKERFLHFDIDMDTAEKLSEFLLPHFRLDVAHWQTVGRTHRLANLSKDGQGRNRS
jgi:hypothetical protein